MNNSKIRLVNENEDIIVNEPDAIIIANHDGHVCIDVIKGNKKFIMSRFNTYEDAKEIFNSIAKTITNEIEGYRTYKVISQEKKDEAVRLAEKLVKGVHDDETHEFRVEMMNDLLNVLKELVDEYEDEDEDEEDEDD